jgi:hypothetical protein
VITLNANSIRQGIERPVLIQFGRPAEFVDKVVDNAQVAGSQTQDDGAVIISDFNRQACTLESRDSSLANFASGNAPGPENPVSSILDKQEITVDLLNHVQNAMISLLFQLVYWYSY